MTHGLAIPTLRLVLSGADGPSRTVTPTWGAIKGLTRKIEVAEFDTQRSDYLWYIDEFLSLPEGGNTIRAKKVEQSFFEFGCKLGEMLLHGDVEKKWLKDVDHTGSGIIELSLGSSHDEILYQIPWELLRLPGVRVPLHSKGISIVRRILQSQPAVPFSGTSSLRVLAIICRPQETSFIDPRYTATAMLDAIESRHNVTVDFVRPSTFAALRRKLQKADDAFTPYHVLHFDGHGTTIPQEGNVGALCFEGLHGELELIRSDLLGKELSRFNIPLVILEACRTASLSSANETVASTLVKHGVGATIAMSHSVHIDLTRTLFEKFYECVAGGDSISIAFQKSRAHVDMRSERAAFLRGNLTTLPLCDWWVPQLYQQVTDTRLLLPDDGSVEGRKNVAVPTNIPPTPCTGFYGRGNDIHRLEQILVQYPVVILYGLAGIGKTAVASEAARWWVRSGFFEKVVYIDLRNVHSVEEVIARINAELAPDQAQLAKVSPVLNSKALWKARTLIIWDHVELIYPIYRPGSDVWAYTKVIQECINASARVMLVSRNSYWEWPGEKVPIYSLHTLDFPSAFQLIFASANLKASGLMNFPGEDMPVLAEILIRVGRHTLTLELIGHHLKTLTARQILESLPSVIEESTRDSLNSTNNSVQSSIDYSLKVLPPQTAAILPQIRLLAGGIYEELLFNILELEMPVAVEAVNGLSYTGLVKVEGRFVHIHPMLFFVKGIVSSPEVESKFVNAVGSYCVEIYGALEGKDARQVLKMLANMEIVARRALLLAQSHHHKRALESIFMALDKLLENTNRGSERLRLSQLVQGSFTSTLYERNTLIEQSADDVEIIRNLGVRAVAARRREDEDPQFAVRELRSILDQHPKNGSRRVIVSRIELLVSLSIVQGDRLGDLREAIYTIETAIELLSILANRGEPDLESLRTAVLGEYANLLRQLGDLQKALTVAMEAYQAAFKEENVSNQITATSRIGQILLDSRRFQEAKEALKKALAMAHADGDARVLAFIHKNLGDVELALGQDDEALRYLTQALKLYRAENDQWQEAAVLNSVSNIEQHRRNIEEALVWSDQLQGIGARLKSPLYEGVANYNKAALFFMKADEVGEDGRRALLQSGIEAARNSVELLKLTDRDDLKIFSQERLARGLQQDGQWVIAEIYAQNAYDGYVGMGATEKVEAILDLLDLIQHRQSYAPQFFSDEVVNNVLEIALDLRGFVTEGVMSLHDAIRDLSPAFVEQVMKKNDWLFVHFRAIINGGPQPEIYVPRIRREFIDELWSDM